MCTSDSNKRARRGRQKVPISKIENESSRNVTFSKRRDGLFKKASELSILCGVNFALVAFSPTNKGYGFGSPSLDEVLDVYFNEDPIAQDNAREELFRVQDEGIVRYAAPKISDMEDRIDEQTKFYQDLCEEEENRESINKIPLSVLQHRKRNLEMLWAQILERKNLNKNP